MLELLTETAQKTEKSKNAVIVNCPELGADDVDTANRDWEMVQEIFHAAGLPPDQLLDVKRHGKKREKKPRVLTVYMDSESWRNGFLPAFYKYKPVMGRNSYCC